MMATPQLQYPSVASLICDCVVLAGTGEYLIDIMFFLFRDTLKLLVFVSSVLFIT